MNEPWVTRQEIAEHLGASLDRVDQLVREGMPSVVINEDAGERKHRRFRRSKVDEWLEENAAANGAGS